MRHRLTDTGHRTGNQGYSTQFISIAKAYIDYSFDNQIKTHLCWVPTR